MKPPFIHSLLGMLALLAMLLQPCQGQTLGRVKEEVREGPTADSSLPDVDLFDDDDDDDHCRHCDDDDENDLKTWGFITLMGALAVTAPWWGPVKATNDDYSVDLYFQHHPYQDGAVGYLSYEKLPATSSPFWGGRVSAEYGSDFGDIDRYSTNVHLGIMHRLESEFEWTHLEESAGSFSDSLDLGEINLLFRFAQAPGLQFHSGLGLTWLSDSVDTEFGWNVNWGFICEPMNPIIISTDLDWGYIGDAAVFRGRSTLGVVWHGYELYFGFDYLNIETVEVGSLISGVRVWF